MEDKECKGMEALNKECESVMNSMNSRHEVSEDMKMISENRSLVELFTQLGPSGDLVCYDGPLAKDSREVLRKALNDVLGDDWGKVRKRAKEILEIQYKNLCVNLRAEVEDFISNEG